MNADDRDPGELIGGGREFMEEQMRLWKLLGPRMALGWATVELERGVREVGKGFQRYGSPIEAAVPDDDVLGARCRLLTFDEDFPVVVLEPKTEGRLAAALARHGEGSVVMYTIVDDDLAHQSRRLVEAHVQLGAVASGPFGLERLVFSYRDGPFLILASTRRQPDADSATVTIER